MLSPKFSVIIGNDKATMRLMIRYIPKPSSGNWWDKIFNKKTLESVIINWLIKVKENSVMKALFLPGIQLLTSKECRWYNSLE
jgi:hypothetical protein